MWPFTKRRKLTLQDLPLPKEISRPRRMKKQECPDILKHTSLCVCAECPRKETCVIETIAQNSTNCKNFVRYCSVKNQLTSGGGDLYKHALEEFNEYIDGRYL